MLSKGIYTQDLFDHVDILISDVSSVIIDFLITGKPIIINKLSNPSIINEFSDKIYSIAPVVESQKDLQNALISPDLHKQQRQDILTFTHDIISFNEIDNVFKILLK